MRKSIFFAAALVMAVSLAAPHVALASSSDGASSVNVHCDPTDPQCGPFPGMAFNPVLQGQLPPYVTIAPECPEFIATDLWTLDFINGSAVTHQTTNKNGGWGGVTAEGQAALTGSDGSLQYAGQVQERSTSGGNSPSGTNQTVSDFTLNFNGSGAAGTISIHVNNHLTTNNLGAVTSFFLSGRVACA